MKKDNVDLDIIVFGICESCREMFDAVDLDINEVTDQMECEDCRDAESLPTCLEDVGQNIYDFVREG